MNRPEHDHFNRIKSIIQHKDNHIQHVDSINTLIENFKNMFGETKLYKKLIELKNENK